MKRIAIIFTIILGFSLLHMSCSDWLDVDPKTEVKEKDLFTNEEGFKDALIGLYIVMKSDSLYGTKMTMTTLEYLAQHWTISKSQSLEYRLSDYDYKAEDVKKSLTDIYAQLYYDIAQANNIINSIDDKKSIFTGVNYELIKGEALGIRAFLHFDLLRLFGPVPEYGNQVSTVLPYVKTISISYHPHVNYQTYIKLLEDDILEALEYLETFDPLVFKDVAYSNYNNPNLEEEDEFLSGRSQRMNYYAVKGLQARFYLWTGRTTEAYECALELINAKKEGGESMFPLGTRKEIDQGNKTLTPEHLLSMHVYNLGDISNSLFNNDEAIEKREVEVVNDLFPGSTTDIRFNHWWKKMNLLNGTEKFVITKYDQSTLAAKVIPLIRISEMYLIASETAPNLNESQRLLNEFLTARDVTGVTINNESEKIDYILNEYRKDFYAEGQMFFQYKRLFWQNLLWTTKTGSRSLYEIPLPDGEIIYE